MLEEAKESAIISEVSFSFINKECSGKGTTYEETPPQTAQFTTSPISQHIRPPVRMFMLR